MTKKDALYCKIIDILEDAPKTRRQLIDEYIASLALTREEMLDNGTRGRKNIARSTVGQAIEELIRRGIVIRSAEGIYSAASQKPVVIRNERCEREILKLLAGGAMPKSQIKARLTEIFGTDKTMTRKDDNKLSAYASDILRDLSSRGIIVYSEGRYSLPDRIAAKIDDISSMLSLKQAFLTRLHKRGGEYFELYFMTLLEKYLMLHGKTVISSSVVGGAMDGGIDGVAETVDILGFKETIMVQTKNRQDATNETDIRAFYGAVCARQGSRGIFATTSDFHYAAQAFLDGIDNCVGVDGDMIFDMARETLYGLKRSSGELTIDEKII